MQKLSPVLVELVKLIARDLAHADLTAQRMQADTPRKRPGTSAYGFKPNSSRRFLSCRPP